MNGYGYQWKISPGACRAQQIEAGDMAPGCEGSSDLWFWGIAAVALAAAMFLPAKRRVF